MEIHIDTNQKLTVIVIYKDETHKKYKNIDYINQNECFLELWKKQNYNLETFEAIPIHNIENIIVKTYENQ